jgi:hypothetical protein
LPVYLGASSRPRFTLERPDKKPADSGDDKLLNVGELGEHLFRVGPAGKLDWATKIFVVIGTRSVKAWLTEYGVSGMYEKIRSQTEFR